jgi:hypothetical protein
MRRFPLVPLAVSLSLVAPIARGAQITEVADAVDGDDPFDANVEIKFDLIRNSGLIVREHTQPPENDENGEPRMADVKESLYERVRFRLRPRLEVGIFHDLAAFAEWPIVIWDQQSFGYPPGTDENNSTIARDQAPNPSPPLDNWNEDEGSGNTNNAISGGKFGFPGKKYNDWRFKHAEGGAFTGYRQGFDNPTFGLRFSPLNNERDDTKPTITLQADYTPPFLPFMDPTNDNIEDSSSPGPVADGAHRFHFSVAMSKRFLILDPYFVLEYGLPLPAGTNGSIAGYFPRQSGGFTMGMEIVPYEDLALKQRFAIDVSAFAHYFAPGRDYSEVSDVLMEQTFTDQWVRTGLQLGIFFRAFEYFFFNVQGHVARDTEHLLTIEDFGDDLETDENREVDLNNPAERNVYFNPAVDTVGRRFKIEDSLQLGVLVHIGLTF